MYQVQCLQGHFSPVEEGSELAARCEDYHKRGFVDALGVSYEDCPECRADAEQERRRNLRMCGEFGCAMGEDDCRDRCLMAAG